MFKALKKGKRKGHLTFQSQSIPQTVLLTALVLTAPAVNAENSNDKATELSTINVEAQTALDNGVAVSRKVSTTSTKTATPLNKTPQSVTVVTSEDIQEKGATSVADSFAYSAGVVSNYRGTSNRNDEVMARGMSSYLPQYLDGISFASGSSGKSLSAQIDPWLLERVELIHGPASVLYGQSNPGGLINMTSKRPTEETIREVEFGYGTDNQREFGFDIAGPASDDGKVFYRITGITRAKDGQENYVKEERYAIAPSVTIKPTDATTFTILTSFQNDPYAGYRNFLPVEGTLTTTSAGYIPRDFFVSDPNWEKAARTQKSVGYALEHKVNDSLTVRQNARYADMHQDTQTILYSYATGTTLNRFARKFEDDATSVGVDNQAEIKFNQGAAAHTLLAGLDYKHFAYLEKYQTARNGVDSIDWANPTYGLDTSSFIYSTNSWDNADNKQTRKQTGVYLQDQIAINQWNLVASARHDWADIELEDYQASSNDETKTDKTTGRVGVLYAFENGVSPYVSYSTSFEPNSDKGPDGKILKPTTAKQTEVGVKFQPKGSKSSVTAAVFDLRQKDVASYDYTTASYQQTGEVGSKGLELDTNLHLTDAWKVTTAYAYTDAEVLQDETASNIGLTPQWIPKHSGSIWNSYGFINGVTTAAGWRYMGSAYSQNNQIKTPAYQLYDLSIGYDLAKASAKLDGAKLQLTVNNVFDKRYVSACSNYDCFYGSGRSAMLKANYAW